MIVLRGQAEVSNDPASPRHMMDVRFVAEGQLPDITPEVPAWKMATAPIYPPRTCASRRGVKPALLLRP